MPTPPKRKPDSARRANRIIQQRTLLLLALLGIGTFLLLFAQLYKLQIKQHDELKTLAVRQQTLRTTVEASRGTIYDKNGDILALSSTAENVCVSPLDVAKNEQDQDLIANGLGEILGVDPGGILDDMKDTASQYKVIKKKVEQDTKYARQSGGKGQYGHVKIRVEPNESGKGYEFINKVVGGAIPKEYIPAIDAGIQGAMLAGTVAGYPVVDVKVTLYDGSYHEVDSSEMAFKIAGSMAFKEAMREADPVLLEPIMKVCVIVPDEYMGDVIGDLNARRGQIQGYEMRSGAQQIDAFVPLSEMFGYATNLRSRTQGRGQYTMEPRHYVELPKSLQEKLVSKHTGKSE